MQRGKRWQILLLVIVVITDHNLFTEGRCRRLPRYTFYDCQPPWQMFGYNCYWYVAVTKNYNSAEQHCQTNSQPGRLAHLASVLSDEENQFINNLTGGASAWIGFNDKAAEGVYTWLDGSPVDYTNWKPGCPVGDRYGNQDCMQLFGGPQWKDYFCGNTLKSVCKMPRYALA
ncbi:alpha-N-acetylgalactosamine-specific lectin-like [Patiria miniata]|uniref:C-type lectin domain-containing protein n=1 Tax=Patiria miniata TaxID=46514 RepID=A0A913ZWM1_PATMI|nr:alpha-N-acetylgalactosamine-specific lectin-like [Patiria miniata]